MARLLSPFNLQITESVKSDMMGLFHTMDYLDQLKEHTCLKLLDTQNMSLDIDAHIIDYLGNPETKLHKNIPGDVQKTLNDFRARLYEKNIQDEYVAIYNKILALDQVLSTTVDNNAYIENTIKIWRYYDRFFVSLLWDVLDEKAKRLVTEFFIGITLADNYEDLDDDYEEWHIKIKKNILLQIKFLLAISKSLARAIMMYPDKAFILNCTVRYLLGVVKWSKSLGE